VDHVEAPTPDPVLDRLVRIAQRDELRMRDDVVLAPRDGLRGWLVSSGPYRGLKSPTEGEFAPGTSPPPPIRAPAAADSRAATRLPRG
jgi:hypothetical protein